MTQYGRIKATSTKRKRMMKCNLNFDNCVSWRINCKKTQRDWLSQKKRYYQFKHFYLGISHIIIRWRQNWNLNWRQKGKFLEKRRKRWKEHNWSRGWSTISLYKLGQIIYLYDLTDMRKSYAIFSRHCGKNFLTTSYKWQNSSEN